MNQAGVRILAGTDSGAMFAIAGFSLHDELSELVNSGLTPLEALRTATINPARFLHRARRAGSIEAGKEADVVLLDGDPLRDVRNTGRIRAVIARGRLFNREQLNALLDEARRKARASPDPGPAKPPATPASFERTSD
jgi:imidazolonepropionase-like amidohydrolase